MVPGGGELAAAVVCLSLGLLTAAGAVLWSSRSGNRLYLVCALGMLAFAAGIVGQRSYPAAAPTGSTGAEATGRPGPWDAGIPIPASSLHMTPVTLGGLIAAIGGLALVLFFEAPRPPQRTAAPPRSPEEDDAV